MRSADKAEFMTFFEKGHQHLRAANWALSEGDCDAAVTNFCIALINYLDALSINRFGKNLSSSNHEAAATLLLQQLNSIGVADFKTLSSDCLKVLKMKNMASYRSVSLTFKEARIARQIVEKVRDYVESRFDRTIIPIE
jgi:hypothetical protein